MEGIEGKVVVITGASSGLGEATARHLSAEGAVVGPSRRSSRADSVPNHRKERAPMTVEMKVNGKSVSVEVPADPPLLWVLRDALGTGVRRGPEPDSIDTKLFTFTIPC